MSNALKSVFDQGRIPDHLRTDKSVEFKNRTVQKLTKDLEIKQFYTQNESKAISLREPLRTLNLASVAIAVIIKPTDGSMFCPK